MKSRGGINRSQSADAVLVCEIHHGIIFVHVSVSSAHSSVVLFIKCVCVCLLCRPVHETENVRVC